MKSGDNMDKHKLLLNKIDDIIKIVNTDNGMKWINEYLKLYIIDNTVLDRKKKIQKIKSKYDIN